MLIAMVIVGGIVVIAAIIAVASLVANGNISLSGGKESPEVRAARESVLITQYEAQTEFFENAKDMMITARHETPPEKQLEAMMVLKDKLGKDIFGKPGAPLVGELLPPKKGSA